MNTPTELLPCPFCGGEPNEMRGVFRGDGSVMEWDGETHIYCTSCKASVCVGVGGNIDLSHWNTRAQQPSGALREALVISRSNLIAWAETAQHFAGNKTPLGDLKKDLAVIDQALAQPDVQADGGAGKGLRVTGYRGNPTRLVLNDGRECSITSKLLSATARFDNLQLTDGGVGVVQLNTPTRPPFDPDAFFNMTHSILGMGNVDFTTAPLAEQSPQPAHVSAAGGEAGALSKEIRENNTQLYFDRHQYPNWMDEAEKQTASFIQAYGDKRAAEAWQEAVACYVPDGNTEVFRDKILKLINKKAL